ncbi:GH3 auxin-responsive promoter family protein, partial [Acinetobacter baumannii]
GTHYWSVSWLPESQREVLKDKNLNDDSALLGIGKRILSKFTQAVPSNVAFAANADDALFATICYLVANRNLAMMSVWSPTFALQLLERLESMQQDVVEVLQSGKWGSRQASLKEVTAPHSPESAQALIASSNGEQIDFKKLWPKLSLVS